MKRVQIPEKPLMSRAAEPRTLGSLFLIALFLISGFTQPISGIGSLTPGADQRREADRPNNSGGNGSGNEYDYSERTSPTPVEEEDAHGGRNVTELGHLFSARLARGAAQLRITAYLPYVRLNTADRHGLRPRFERASRSPRTSGRTLRNWIESRTC